MISSYDICVVGGAGHVGAPLSIVLANRGLRVLILDIDKSALSQLASGEMPFLEAGGEKALRQALQAEKLGFSHESSSLQGVPVVIVTVGTPIDEFHNPQVSGLVRCMDGLIPHLSADQVIILRSTVAPGTTNFLHRYLAERGLVAHLAFCPERVVQGKAIEEIQTLPQIVSGTTPRALAVATEIFGRIAPTTVEASVEEAEFAKLICNAYRYIEFAATNQLYMMVESAGVNYHRLLEKMKRDYPRMAGIPGPGLTAGPCLMKDTMQLAAFSKQNFMLGHVAMMINEGLPGYLVDRLAQDIPLQGARVGILGMAFKGESDDIRDALSFKLAKILRFRGATVICSDEYVQQANFVTKESLLAEVQAVIIGVPHRAYRDLIVPEGVRVIDLWAVLNPS